MRKKFVTRARPEKLDVSGFIGSVNRAALPVLEALCADWTSGGKRIGAEFVTRNPTRVDRSAGSFKINLRTGRWADFATGDTGGDPVSLYAYIHGIGQLQAAKALGAKFGVTA